MSVRNSPVVPRRLYPVCSAAASAFVMLGLMGAFGTHSALAADSSSTSAQVTSETPPSLGTTDTGVIEARPVSPNGGSRVIGLKLSSATSGAKWIAYEGYRRIELPNRETSRIPRWAEIHVIANRGTEVGRTREWKSALRMARQLHKQLGLESPLQLNKSWSDGGDKVLIQIRW